MAFASTRTASTVTSARSFRRPVIAVRGGFLKDVGAGFTRIFTPRGKDVPSTGAPYSGKPRRSSRKPLSHVPYAPLKAAADEAAPAQGATGEDTSGLGYVNKAAQQVVTGNWKGVAEPGAWSGEGSAAPSGWSSDVHSRHRKGFHNIKAPVQPSSKPKTADAEGAAAEGAAAEGAAAEEDKGTSNDAGNVVSFLGEAAENVVAHNFTGDKTEPEAWKGKGESASGWKGDIHTRKREGFHTIRE